MVCARHGPAIACADFAFNLILRISLSKSESSMWPASLVNNPTSSYYSTRRLSLTIITCCSINTLKRCFKTVQMPTFLVIVEVIVVDYYNFFTAGRKANGAWRETKCSGVRSRMVSEPNYKDDLCHHDIIIIHHVLHTPDFVSELGRNVKLPVFVRNTRCIRS